MRHATARYSQALGLRTPYVPGRISKVTFKRQPASVHMHDSTKGRQAHDVQKSKFMQGGI